VTALAEGLTGIATSDRKELGLSIGYIFQRLRGGQFLSQLTREWKKFQEKGRIKDDYQFTEQHKVCLQEVLDFLDKDSPDEMRFSALKQVFLLAATEEISDRHSILPQQYMKICRTLTSGEILVLNACYQMTQEEEPSKAREPATRWLDKVAKVSGLEHPALVAFHEDELINKKLLSERLGSERGKVFLNPYFRLTSLAYDICKYIESYTD